MTFLSELRELNNQQRHTVLASFLGWTLDAFDFFLLTFAVSAIAADFKVGREQVFVAVTFTLAARPLGAFLFGRLAERFGRRPILMLDIVLFSAFEFATAFSPNLAALILLRFLFGFAMGGEWGIGASLALESIPAKARGVVSGLLQEGYAVGGLLAGLVFALFFDRIGWRGLFMVGALPALLVIYLRAKVPESSRMGKCTARAAAGAQDSRGDARLLGSRAVSRPPHDAVQLLQPRLAGRLSDVSESAARPERASDGNRHHDHGDRGNCRRSVLWRAVVANRAPQGHHCSAFVAAHDLSVGLQQHRCNPGLGCLPDAVHGAGRLGHRTRAFERAVAECRARHVAGSGLPDRQLSSHRSRRRSWRAGRRRMVETTRQR
jgi:hypothetical protein